MALALVALAGIISAVGFGVAWSNYKHRAVDSQQVRDRAQEFVLALTNFSPTTATRDLATLTQMSSGDAAVQSAQILGGRTLEEIQIEGARSSGHLRYLYIQWIQQDRSQVYAEVAQTYTNALSRQVASKKLALVLSLTRISGAWKVSDLSLVS